MNTPTFNAGNGAIQEPIARPPYVGGEDTLVTIDNAVYGYMLYSDSNQLVISGPEGNFAVTLPTKGGTEELMLLRLTREDPFAEKPENHIQRNEWPAFVEKIIAESGFKPEKKAPQYLNFDVASCTYSPNDYDGLKSPEDFARQANGELPASKQTNVVSIGKTKDGSGLVIFAGGVNIGVVRANTLIRNVGSSQETSDGYAKISPVDEKTGLITLKLLRGTITATEAQLRKIYADVMNGQRATDFENPMAVDDMVRHTISAITNNLR
ncbi:MAG: hypothetical protein WC897_00060 [Candidatus Gracilibacteria bacterium]